MSGFLHRDTVEPRFKAERDDRPRRPGLSRVSKKRRAEERELDAAKVEVRRRSHGRCEAVGFPHRCSGTATEFHHVGRRRGPDRHHPSNLLHLCLMAHHEVHANPRLAEEHGLLVRGA